MRKIITVAAIAFVALATTASAQNMRPGRWESLGQPGRKCTAYRMRDGANWVYLVDGGFDGACGITVVRAGGSND